MYLGLDIGTSAVKALLLGEDHRVAAEAQAPLTIQRPHPLWSEQDPEAWWRAACRAINALPADLRAQVRAVGLSGQMHGATLLDASRNVLRPAILWNDGRSAAECEELERIEPRSRGITGNATMPGFTAPKLLWVRRHEPELFAAIALVLLPKDYVRLKLTGEAATDLSDAAGTLWVDCANRGWSGAMLDACGLGQEQMPALYEGNVATGTLRSQVAGELGLPVVPVAAGAGDNAAGAIGSGAINEGDSVLSLGTSGVLFVANERFAPAAHRGAHAFCHALPERWQQTAVILSAAACLDWVARLTGQPDVAGALRGVEQTTPFSGPEIFLPYLSGERTPHNNPHASGVFFGLNADSDGPALVRAVLEGVALALTDGLDALREAGTRIESTSVTGGGARSAYWGRILAAALGLPLVYRDDAHVGPALGAARLARLAVTGERPHEVCPPPAILSVVEPDIPLADAARARHARFRALYPALKDQFR
jgi:xylulokinase